MHFALTYGMEFTNTRKGQRLIGAALAVVFLIGCCFGGAA